MQDACPLGVSTVSASSVFRKGCPQKSLGFLGYGNLCNYGGDIVNGKTVQYHRKLGKET